MARQVPGDVDTAAVVSGTFTTNTSSAALVARGSLNLLLTGATFGGGNITLERSFDGGSTFFAMTRDGSGAAIAAFTAAANAVIQTGDEPNVQYRLTMAAGAAQSVPFRLSCFQR